MRRVFGTVLNNGGLVKKTGLKRIGVYDFVYKEKMG